MHRAFYRAARIASHNLTVSTAYIVLMTLPGGDFGGFMHIEHTTLPQRIRCVEGHKKADVLLLDASQAYPNDRFAAVILDNIARKPNETAYTFIHMNSLGMYGFGEFNKDYLDAVTRQEPEVTDHFISWSDLPEACQNTLKRLLPSFLA